MLHKIRSNVRSRHKLNYRFGYELLNTETGEYTVWYKNINSPWFPKLSETQAWLQEQENLRLQGENIDRPSTKWDFQRHVFIDLRVILDQQPLQIGHGRLPDWLRNKREFMALDTYNDNKCLFRSIAVHQGADRRFNTRRTRELEQSFSAAYPKLPFITLQHLPLLEKHFSNSLIIHALMTQSDCFNSVRCMDLDTQ